MGIFSEIIIFGPLNPQHGKRTGHFREDRRDVFSSSLSALPCSQPCQLPGWHGLEPSVTQQEKIIPPASHCGEINWLGEECRQSWWGGLEPRQGKGRQPGRGTQPWALVLPLRGMCGCPGAALYPGIGGHCLFQRLLEQCPSGHQLEGTPSNPP